MSPPPRRPGRGDGAGDDRRRQGKGRPAARKGRPPARTPRPGGRRPAPPVEPGADRPDWGSVARRGARNVRRDDGNGARRDQRERAAPPPWEPEQWVEDAGPVRDE